MYGLVSRGTAGRGGVVLGLVGRAVVWRGATRSGGARLGIFLKQKR